jgi:hypothetical protein
MARPLCATGAFPPLDSTCSEGAAYIIAPLPGINKVEHFNRILFGGHGARRKRDGREPSFLVQRSAFSVLRGTEYTKRPFESSEYSNYE